MNLLQIEAELGRDDLPTVSIHVGDHTHITFEVLRPRWGRWHWWLDKGRHATQHTIMCPVGSIEVERWGADRGDDSMPSTVVLPKAAVESFAQFLHDQLVDQAALLRTILTKTEEDQFGPVDLGTLRSEPFRSFDADEMRNTMHFPDEYKTPEAP